MEKELRQRQIVMANLLTLGLGILTEVGGNDCANKITTDQEKLAEVLGARINSNLEKHKGTQL